MGLLKMLRSFAFGVIFTLVMAVVVPFILSTFIHPSVESSVSEIELLTGISSVVTGLIMLACSMAFSFFLGGTFILKQFGIPGIIGLVAAYYLLGDVTMATIPIAMMIVGLVVCEIL